MPNLLSIYFYNYVLNHSQSMKTLLFQNTDLIHNLLKSVENQVLIYRAIKQHKIKSKNFTWLENNLKRKIG